MATSVTIGAHRRGHWLTVGHRPPGGHRARAGAGDRRGRRRPSPTRTARRADAATAVRRPRRLIGLYVPQWIGTTSRGWMSSVACAARCGSRWPVPERRAPSGDRQQRHVDRRQVSHPVEQIGVAGEVHRPLRRAQHVADGAGADPAVRPTSRRVHGWDGLDGHDAERGAITDGGFDDVAESRGVAASVRPPPARPGPRRRAGAATARGGDPCGRGRSARHRRHGGLPCRRRGAAAGGRARAVSAGSVRNRTPPSVDEGAGVAEPADLQAIVGGHGRERRSRTSK